MKKTYIIPSVCIFNIEPRQILALSLGMSNDEVSTALDNENYMDDQEFKPWYRQ